MQAKSDVELERARIVKITRALIRLKHSLNADVEINSVLTDRLLEFDKGLQDGELKQLYTGIDEILES